MNTKVDIYGINIDNVNLAEALIRVKSYLLEDRPHIVFTPNSEIIMAAKRDSHLTTILNSADLVVPDGAGVVVASKILGTGLKERVAGFDLISAIFNSQDFKENKFFFFGTKQSIIEKATENISHKYRLAITGFCNGYFKKEDEPKIIDTINSSGAEFLLVALGAPSQEKWIYDNKDKLKVKVVIGVGGSFDVFAGNIKRAPIFFQRNNLEWLYRLYKEPWRYKRMLDLPIFIWFVILLKLKNILKKLVN